MSNYAYRILEAGFQNLVQRNGSVDIEGMETEVNFQTCRYILENYGDSVRSVPEINRINEVVNYNSGRFSEIISDFLEAGNQMFPQHWQKDKDGIFIHMISANLSWSGMWDYLTSYFLKSHGENIDNSEKEALIFYSRKHTRFENGFYNSEATVERNINILLIDGGSEAIISIEPSLSAKKAFLIVEDGNKLVYRGEDKSYEFTIFMDDYNEVEKFILFLKDRDVRIEYY